jgi:hypothetical protein
MCWPFQSFDELEFCCLNDYKTVLEYSLSLICLVLYVFQIQLMLGSQSSVAVGWQKKDEKRTATGEVKVLLCFLHKQSFVLEISLPY